MVNDIACGGCKMFLRDGNGLVLYPVGTGNTLTREGLEIFDRVLGSVDEEFADDVQAFVIGEVSGWFIFKGFAI